MKSLRVFRFNALAGSAGLALLAALWFDAPDGPDDAAAPGAKARQRAAHGSATATPAHAASAGALRATHLLGGAAMAATADRPASAPAAPRATATPAADRNSARAALAALDTALVAQRVVPAAAAENAFATKSWFVTPPAPPPMPEPPPPPPPPPPQAPPLPFKYMGSMHESAQRTVWYLQQGERLIVAGSGDVIDSTYRTEGVEGGQLRFTYLPLNQRQTLSIGVPP